MQSANPWSSYRQVATQTASPGQLVLMLLDGAIKFLERALVGFDLEDPAESNQTIHNNISHAQEIIRELNQSLDLGQGGDVALDLRSLYVYFDRRLTEGNLRKVPEGIREVARHLGEIRDGWSEMLKQQRSLAPAACVA